MTLLAVDAEEVPGQREALRRALRGHSRGMPVLIMIHGFRYAPGVAGSDPHAALYALDPSTAGPRVVSWPRHMGFRDSAPSGMIGIGFGWRANGTLWHAQRSAHRAAEGLARTIRIVRDLAPDARIGILAHSLGARVALTALRHLPAGSLDTAVLMAAAEFRSLARRSLDAPAGRTAGIVNVTSRENDVFDLLNELAAGCTGRAVGRGLGQSRTNWIDVQIDHEEVRAGLARLGFRIAPPARRICHWSSYLRPGIFALYRALLTDPDPLPLAALRSVLPPCQARHWSRLLAPPGPPLLPSGGSA